MDCAEERLRCIALALHKHLRMLVMHVLASMCVTELYAASQRASLCEFQGRM